MTTPSILEQLTEERTKLQAALRTLDAQRAATRGELAKIDKMLRAAGGAGRNPTGDDIVTFLKTALDVNANPSAEDLKKQVKRKLKDAGYSLNGWARTYAKALRYATEQKP
jgi:hypothetical protein